MDILASCARASGNPDSPPQHGSSCPASGQTTHGGNSPTVSAMDQKTGVSRPRRRTNRVCRSSRPFRHGEKPPYRPPVAGARSGRPRRVEPARSPELYSNPARHHGTQAWHAGDLALDNGGQRPGESRPSGAAQPSIATAPHLFGVQSRNSGWESFFLSSNGTAQRVWYGDIRDGQPG